MDCCEYEWEINRLKKLKEIYEENMIHYKMLSKTADNLEEKALSNLTVMKARHSLNEIEKALLNGERLCAGYRRKEQFIMAPNLPKL